MNLLAVPEVAAILHCSESAVRDLINAPAGIRASKPGRRWLISPDDLADFLDAQANRAPARRRRRRAS